MILRRQKREKRKGFCGSFLLTFSYRPLSRCVLSTQTLGPEAAQNLFVSIICEQCLTQTKWPNRNIPNNRIIRRHNAETSFVTSRDGPEFKEDCLILVLRYMDSMSLLNIIISVVKILKKNITFTA
jgi:hypothetical protein